ncbi:MAG: hypothetical protein EWM47_01985 [Anaerolineaceae bacterium]|nr:MAG: hypothetical protein EWM47_01985 [Anaerolineaceae bacterium]
MLRFRKMKGLAVLMSICMLFGMINTNAYAQGDNTASDHYEEESAIQLFGMGTAEAVTGSAIYVGGPDATGGNDGSSTKPYLTLKEAAVAINGKGAGSYQIIMLGDTSESSRVDFGNGEAFNISITTSPVSEGAIRISKTSKDDSMIFISNNTTLTLEGRSAKEKLIFDGGGETYKGNYALINVWDTGTLNLNANTSIQNRINTYISPGLNHQGGGIINHGTLNINGGEVSNNRNYYGGGIFNYGNLIMNSGSISNNYGDNKGGGVYNLGYSFTLYSGTISNNTGSSGSGLYNDEGDIIINGGTITQNSSDCIYNNGTITMNDGEITANDGSQTIRNVNGIYNMTGGTISNNKHTANPGYFRAIEMSGNGEFNLSGGSIINNQGGTTVYVTAGHFNMTGGIISDNSPNSALIFVSTNGSFSMSDGEIRNNSGRVLDISVPITISNNAKISGEDGGEGIILLGEGGGHINVNGTLSNIASLRIELHFPRAGRQIVDGPILTDDLLSKFVVDDPNYSIDNAGKLSFTGEASLFYVSEAGSDDESVSGSSEDPLLTIAEAVDRIGTANGTVIIQSDLDVVNPIIIVSDISIKSDDTTIILNNMIPDDALTDYMFIVFRGILTLGDKDQTSGELIIDNADAAIDTLIGVFDEGILNIHKGATIRNSGSKSGAIKNVGSVINIDGGSITNCKEVAISNYDSGIINVISGEISAASEDNDNSAGIRNFSDSTVNISGGIISGFNGDMSCGIINEGIINLSGGIISENTYSIVNMNKLYMSQNPYIPVGSDNTNGVYLYDYDPIILKDDLGLSDDNQILILIDEIYVDDKILTGDEDTIINYCDNFILPDSNYGISEWGTIKYIGEPIVFYVDANYDGRDSDGSPEDPFKRLEDAINVIHDSAGVGTIYICSDIVIDDEISIYGDITILNYGSTPHTITSTFYNDMFSIYYSGSLTLGKEGEGDDDAPTLLVNGGGREDSNCIIDNEGTLKLYSGVKLYGNKGMNGWDTGAVVNSGTFYMYGGVISDNIGALYGAVRNGHIFIMEGGRISNCSGEIAGGIMNYSGATFIMSGGIVEDNNSDDGVGIYNEGTMTLSKGATIPMKDNKNKIWLYNTSYINIESNLSTIETILLATSAYIPGRQILIGDASIISNNYKKFVLDPTVTDYRLAEDGSLEYIGLTMDYYVDEELGSDSNSGSKALPFATLSKAISSIEEGSGVGTVHIRSDIVIEDTIEINGAIKLVNDGDPHEILRSPSFRNDMFVVYGQLELGDSELDGRPEASLLTINGNRENVESWGSLIYNNEGSIVLHNGTALENNYTGGNGGAIYNEGSLIMRGGVIKNNTTRWSGGGIYNDARLTILGGSIRNNEANDGGGIYNYDTLTLSGGSIYDNIACYGGGIENYMGTMNIQGGSIHNNKAEFGGGLALYSSDTVMSAGEIYGNTGLDDEEFSMGNGIDLDFATLTILGNASIADDNEIALSDYLEDKLSWSSFIIVGGSLSDDVPVMKLVKYYYDPDTYEVTIYNPLGNQIIKPATDYSLTAQDISKFQMADSNYGINIQGKIAERINDSWFSLVNAENIYYTGSEIRPVVSGMKDTTTLMEGRDYQVNYKNNINVGIATVYVTGMGNYGGTVIKTFTIKSPTYTISAHAGDNGNITPSGSIKVNANSDQSFSIVPAAGYTIASVTVDDVNMGAINSYTFTNITRNHSISVTFRRTSSTPTPTPKPQATPTPTTPLPSGPIREMDAEVSMTISHNQQRGVLNTSIRISTDTIESLDDGSGQTMLTIHIGSDELSDAMQDDSISNVNIDLILPDSITQNGSVAGSRILLDPDIISTARDSEKDINISIKDEEGKERYSWSFSGSDLTASNKEISELDLSLNIQRAEDNEDLTELLDMDSQTGSNEQNSLVINFGHHGDLPAQARVRMFVGDMGYKEGDKLYLYYYNSETGKLDTLPFSTNYVVDSEGYITVDVIHCSDYVLLPDKAKSGTITSLRKQISVTPNKITLHLGSKDKSSASLEVNLPKTLEQVVNLKDKTSGSAIGAVKITYKSGNTRVATVDSSGKITAKKNGKANITVTVTLYSGKTITFKISVTVKKA